MTVRRPRVFTIAPSAPFLPTLIDALLKGKLIPGFSASDDPLALAGVSIYLPTRRACRLAQDMFLDVLGADAALLPRLSPIGDVDEDELVFAERPGPLDADAGLPEALEPLERRLLLARLILQWMRSKDVSGGGKAPLVAAGPASALKLADDLARLIDDLFTRGVPWPKFDGLVPDHHDDYWRLTLEFLKVAREAWPGVLEAHGRIEPALRRDRLLAAEAERLKAHTGPVIAAGSTASMPATALLLSTIARLPQGAVVLPGLDKHLDEDAWQSIVRDPGGADGGALDTSIGHPQFAMRTFLRNLGVHRDEVTDLAETLRPARDRIVSEALRPAAATDKWHALARDELGEGLADIAIIEAANAEEEALAIAVALRETLEHPGKTAALITPDRALARRVMAALARWQVVVDDSGGEALADTPAGVFARLAAEVALGGLEPVKLLALLKHPLLRLGATAEAHGRAMSVLERAIFRGPRPRAGSDGLVRALDSLRANLDTLHRADPRARLRSADLDRASALVRTLQAALAPLEAPSAGARTLTELAAAHRAVIAALGGDKAFAGADGEALERIFDAMDESAAARQFPVSRSEYPEILNTAMRGEVVRPLPNAQARVRIFGLLEARLQHPDRVVLGGLVEGVWPPQARSDPWLSRPMRQALGLDLPERRIGLTAHDFAQALGCSEVVLSRAARVGGAPTVPSRFVQRLAAVAGDAAWSAACRRGECYVAWARSLDRPPSVEPVKAPAPKPPLDVRPSRFSVTEIEDWLRDPYTIYAKRILRLAPLDPVDTPPGARDRGSVIHAAIEEFTKTFAGALPADPLAELIAIGRKHFAVLADFPEAKAFWWPRFERIARWLAAWETRRRPDIEAVLAELRGEIELPLGARSMKLTARADRIERLSDGSYAILDYKTGRVATPPQVRSGLAPQLTLEAAILQQGGFKEISEGATVEAIAYVRLRGGEPAGEECTIEWKDGARPADEARRALARLREVALKFEDPETEYRSLVHSMWSTRYGDYDHLARVKEWSTASDEDEEGGPP